MSIDPLVEEAEAGSEIFPHSTNISDYIFPNAVIASSEFNEPPIIENPSQPITESGGWTTAPTNLPLAKDNDFNTTTTDAGLSGAGGGQYIQADFGNELSRILRVKWKRRTDTAGYRFHIQTAGNDLIFTNRVTVTENTINVDIIEDLQNVFTGVFRYVRVNAERNILASVLVSVFEIRSEGTIVVRQATHSIDNNTATFWKSNNELNPFLRGEFSAIADQEPSAAAIFVDKSKFTATQFLIQTSVDGVAWTLKRTINITQLTDLAYNFIRFNRDVLPIRYIRLIGNDGTAKQFAINEYRALIPTSTQWLERQTHKTISPTSTNIGLAG